MSAMLGSLVTLLFTVSILPDTYNVELVLMFPCFVNCTLRTGLCIFAVADTELWYRVQRTLLRKIAKHESGQVCSDSKTEIGKDQPWVPEAAHSTLVAGHPAWEDSFRQ